MHRTMIVQGARLGFATCMAASHGAGTCASARARLGAHEDARRVCNCMACACGLHVQARGLHGAWPCNCARPLDTRMHQRRARPHTSSGVRARICMLGARAHAQGENAYPCAYALGRRQRLVGSQSPSEHGRMCISMPWGRHLHGAPAWISMGRQSALAYAQRVLLQRGRVLIRQDRHVRRHMSPMRRLRAHSASAKTGQLHQQDQHVYPQAARTSDGEGRASNHVGI
jgi:hypothetical protein